VPALVAFLRKDAAAGMPPQSPYSGRQNVVEPQVRYSRKVICNLVKNICIFKKVLPKMK
jgi:hypothetical protein